MADENIPVKDTSNNAFRNAGPNPALDQKAAQQRRMVSKWSRDELEDKYLRIHEENLLLKKHARKQEDKIKRMATKLLRLVNDKKKQDHPEIGKVAHDPAIEEKMLEMQEKLQTLEKVNAHLKDKLALAKQQAQSMSAGKRTALYPYIQSRINTGIPKHQTVQIDPRIARNVRVVGPVHESPKRVASPPPAGRFGHSLLEETRVQKQHLEDHIAQLQEQLDRYEMDIETLQEQNRLREAEYEEDIIKIKQRITSEQRQSVQENIDMIKLQREVKEKSTHLIALQDKYAALDDNTRVLRHNHDQILMEMERLNVQLKEEQNRVLTLNNELKMANASQRRTVELQEQVVDLQREVDTLKEANEKLVSSAFDLEREREWRQRENKLKVQIAQLEATLKSDLGEKGSIIDRYAHERDAHEKLQQEYRELQIHHFSMKEQFDDMQEKLKFFTKESALDLTELEDALVLVKQKKQKMAPPPDFLHQVDSELDRDHKRQLLELQAEYAETVHELEKTRNMLVVQHKINKDYQRETEVSSQQLQEVRKEYELKLDEYARLLDIRAARIKKLESQLRDVAYGTRQYRLPPPDDDIESTMDLEETLHLERGQNLFEIHINKVNLSEDAIRHIGDEEPSLFCTWEFFEFEIQSTPVLRGSRPAFDFTSQYIVRVDDFFLHYLQKKTCTLELHQTFGQEYRTVAACQLVFRDLFDKPHGRIHGQATLTGITDKETGVGYGTVEYWVRLRVPMEQALRLYKERTKALGYLTANQIGAADTLQALDENAQRRPMDNVNELHIKIIRCAKLKARRPDVQPSPYCVYQFYDFSDHDTVIVRNSNNPEFHDHKTFPVAMTYDLDQYLRSTELKVFVFDDADPEEESFIGQVKIPLVVLLGKKEYKGTFPLNHPNIKAPSAMERTPDLGTMDIELYWQHEYITPKKPEHIPLEMDAAPPDTPTKIPAPPKGTHTRSQGRPRQERHGPTATSTPFPKDKMADVESQIVHAKSRPVDAAASPKPVARQRVRMPKDSDHDQGNLVQDTVSKVVANFMPGMSESISSVAELSTIHTEKELADVAEEQSPAQAGTPQGYSSQEQYSTEEEELVARPTPPRSSLNIESGSASEEDRVGGRQPLERQVPRAHPPPLQSMEDDEESMAEEIEEDVAEDADDAESTLREEEHLHQQATRKSVHSPHGLSDAKASETESEPPQIESDSEGITTVAPPAKRRSKLPKPSDQVTVEISHLSLEEDSPVMTNPAIQKLFVAYNFLGLPPQDTETPFSLPKPKPNRQIQFNFSKTVPVDMERHYEQRQHLAAMLLPDDPEQGRIKFMVVSEPPDEDQEADCEDVGEAYVSLLDILKNKRDIKDEDIDIMDVHDHSKVIGQLHVTVECLAALQAVDLEMQVDGTY